MTHDEPTPSTPHDVLCRKERRAVACALLRRIEAAECREEYVLREHLLRGRTYRAIAADLGCTGSRARQVCLGAVRTLRGVLETFGVTP